MLSYTPYFYVTVSFFLLTIIAYVSWVYSSKTISLNYITFWLLSYFVFFYIGSLIVMGGYADGSYFVQPFKTDYYIKEIGGWVILYAGFASFATFFLFSNLFGMGWRKFSIFNVSVSDVRRGDIFNVNVVFIITIIAFIYYQISIYPSPLVMAFQDYPSVDIAIRRIEVTRNLSELANTYVISILKISVYIVSYSYAAIFSVERKHRLKLVLSIVLSVLTLLSTGEKAPVVFYFIGLVLAFNFAKGRFLIISIRLIFLILMVVFIVYFVFVSSDLNEIFSLMIDRIFIAQSTAVYLSMKHYSAFGDIGLSSLNNVFFKLFGVDSLSKPAAEQLMILYFPEMLLNGGWNINGLFISEAWANFGVVGLVFSPIMVGFENAIVLRVICGARRKSPLVVAIYSYATVNCVVFMTSFNFYLYNSEWLVLLVIMSFFVLSRVLHFLLLTLGGGKDEKNICV